jgi:serine/threonine protein kinase
VHGDIKPENILIDRDSVGSFVAKVADFGYSSMYSIGELHALPRSRPWNAPEASSFEVSFQDAVSADIYSYAMVCLWILFQDKEVGRSSGTNRTWRLKDISSNVTAAEELKYLDEFKRISCKFVNGEEFLDPLRKHELCQFFEQTLIRIDVPGFNQRSRETNPITLKRLLGNGRFLNTSSINTYDIKDVDESTGIPQSDFQVSSLTLVSASVTLMLGFRSASVYCKSVGWITVSANIFSLSCE